MGKRKKLSFRDFVQVSREQEERLYSLFSQMLEVSRLIRQFKNDPGGEILLLLALSFVVAEMMEEEG